MASNLSQFARSRTVRVLLVGTSITANANSAVKQVAAAMQAQWGDSGNRTVHLGALGGSYTEPVNGWKKQPYGGFGFTRLRGESSSTPLKFTGYAKRYVLRYSTDAGGGSCEVWVDGVLSTTLSCAGAQSYGNELVITPASTGQHVVEVKPPASGYIYLETFDTCLDNPGVHILDAALGGSALKDMMVLRAPTGNQVAGIAIGGTNFSQPSNGIDGVFSTQPNTKADLIIDTHTVNDAQTPATTYFIPGQAYKVKRCREQGMHLLIQIEMGGSYALPAQPFHANFELIRTTLNSYRNLAGVTVQDWHARSGLATTDLSELIRLSNRYYFVTGLTTQVANAGTGWGGDYIHPNNAGYALGAEMLIESLGLRHLGRQGDTETAAYQRNRPHTEHPFQTLPLYDPRLLGVPNLSLSNTNTIGQENRYRLVGTSINYTSGLGEPLWQSDEEVSYNPTLLGDYITAAGTSDEFGAYRTISTGSPYGAYLTPPITSTATPGRYTITAIVGPGAYEIRVSNNANTTRLDQVVQGSVFPTGLATNVVYSSSEGSVNTTDKPRVIHLTFETNAAPVFVTFSGKFYGLYLTATNHACIPQARADVARLPAPSALVTGDLPAAKVRLNQPYTEQANGLSIEKIAVGKGVFRPLNTNQKWSGLYQLRDKTSCINQVLTPTGSVTVGAYADAVGAQVSRSNANPLYFSGASSFSSTQAGKTFTVTGTVAYNSAIVKIALYTGSSNTYLALQADGSWVNVAGIHNNIPDLLSAAPTRPLVGTPFAITFTLPDASLWPSNLWQVRVFTTPNQDFAGNYSLCEGWLPTY